MLAAVVLLVSQAGLSSGLTTRGANPIRKVVTLMQDMQKDIEGEVEAEKKLFEKFMCVCQEYPSELKETIEDSAKKVAELGGAVESETGEKTRLVQEVAGHKTEKAEAEKDLSQATMLREKEAAEFAAESASLKASLEGLSKAIPAIEKGGASLLQSGLTPRLSAVVESTTVLTTWQKQQVTSFLHSGASSGDSSEVLGILKQMADDMSSNLAEAERSDKVAADGYTSLKSAKDEQIAVASEAIESKEKRSGALAVSIITNKDALEDATDAKAEAAKMLETLVTTCGTRQKEWEEHFKTRGDEVTAISETIGILNDDDALDVFKKAVPSALVQGKATGFLQTRQAAFRAMEDLRLALHRSRRSARRHGVAAVQEFSRALARNETESELEMIPGHMIENLEKEQEDDVKKKEFCSEEISKAEGVQKSKQEALDALDAELEQITDEVAGINDEVAAIEKQIAELDKSVAKATEQRKEEHQEYVESLTMADAAIQLLAKAKNRLMKFYSPTLYKAPPKKEMTMEEKILASSKSSFIQRMSRRAMKQLPELPTVPKYEKKNSGGVTALIDKLSQDLLLDKSESEHDEKEAQKDYVELMKESGDSRAECEKSVVEKKNSVAALDSKLLEAKESKSQTFMDLTNAHELVQTLHSTCDFLLTHFDEKKEAREAEEEKLKAAKHILHER